MSYILSIETATEICSVALSEGDILIAEKTLTEGMRHSEQLTSLIKGLFKDTGHRISDLSAVAISNGPGSYTGLRVGASTAKGICMALNIPLITIPTLEALTTGISEEGAIVVPTIDARRMEVYTALYRNGQCIKDVHSLIWTEESINDLSRTYDQLIICGNGVMKAKELFGSTENITLVPSQCSASSLTSLAYEKLINEDFADLAYHDPFYYKAPNITKSKKLFG